MSPATREHYTALFAEIAESLGAEREPTFTGMIGFSAGGPVSMRRVGEWYVTCELSMCAEQVESAEGLKFELLSLLDLGERDCHRLLTALGALSMAECLGDLHTVDVSHVLSAAPFSAVQLQLLSRCKIAGRAYGVYGVAPVGA